MAFECLGSFPLRLLSLAHVACETLSLSVDRLLELLLENILSDEFFSLSLNLCIFLLLAFQLLLDLKKSILEHHIVVLGRGLQWLVHNTIDHFLVAFDFELTVGDSGHVLHHLLLGLHHESLSAFWVLASHLEIVLLIFLHSTLERRQVIVNHEAVDREIFLCFELKYSRHGKV